MIVVRLMGGLGNQLFQYAAARHLAYLNNSELFVDTTFLEEQIENTTLRPYGLNAFNVSSTIADEKILKNFRGPSFSFDARMATKILSYGNLNKYKFDDYGFDEELLKQRGNYYIRGYFQSHKYFMAIEQIIRKELEIKQAFLPKDLDLINQIQNEHSVSIHIRRGDYIRNLASMEAHGLCSKDYYVKSIKHIKETLGEHLHFFIFTDDAAWVKKEMQWDINSTLIEKKSTIEDFYYMQSCKHNIIANSTFSWWAAWLNKNEHKIVIMPKHWSNNVLSESADLVPKNWILK
ncbi:MAG: alpha-1,2-fucosyltransferase [Chitinophagales bacterium]|nr:alpha-1,2-fucosyltransferase [Bacteroidota bacterium]